VAYSSYLAPTGMTIHCLGDNQKGLDTKQITSQLRVIDTLQHTITKTHSNKEINSVVVVIYFGDMICLVIYGDMVIFWCYFKLMFCCCCCCCRRRFPDEKKSVLSKVDPADRINSTSKHQCKFLNGCCLVGKNF